MIVFSPDKLTFSTKPHTFLLGWGRWESFYNSFFLTLGWWKSKKRWRLTLKSFKEKNNKRKWNRFPSRIEPWAKDFKSNALPTGLHMRCIHNKHHFWNAIIFCTESKTKQNRRLPLKEISSELRAIEDKYKMSVQYKGRLHRCSVGWEISVIIVKR